MKKMLAGVLLLVLLLGLGSQAQAEGFSITSGKGEKDGGFTITWQDDWGEGPFHVYYQYIDEESQAKQTLWRVSEEVKGNQYTYDQLIPGATYRLTVADSKNNYTAGNFHIPEGEPFQSKQKTKVTLYLKYKTKPGQKDSDAKRDKKLSLATIKKNVKKGYGYGLELRVKFTTKSSKKTVHTGVAAIYAPDGYAGSQGVDHFVLSKARGDTTYFRFLFSDFFKQLFAREEGAPLGEYKVRLYLEGQQYLESSFTLKK